MARRRRKFGRLDSCWRKNVRGTSFLSKKGRGKKQWPAAGEIFLGGCWESFLGGRGQIWLSRGLAILVVRGVWTPLDPPTQTYASTSYNFLWGKSLKKKYWSMSSEPVKKAWHSPPIRCIQQSIDVWLGRVNYATACLGRKIIRPLTFLLKSACSS